MRGRSRLGDRGDQERLGEPGYADQERVSPAQKGGEDAVHYLLLPDDPAADLLPEGTYGPAQLVQEGDIVGDWGLAGDMVGRSSQGLESSAVEGMEGSPPEPAKATSEALQLLAKNFTNG